MPYVLNYTPDFAMRLDVNGNPVERLDHAYRPAKVNLTIGRQSIPAETFFKSAGTPYNCLAQRVRLINKII